MNPSHRSAGARTLLSTTATAIALVLVSACGDDGTTGPTGSGGSSTGGVSSSGGTNSIGGASSGGASSGGTGGSGGEVGSGGASDCAVRPLEGCVPEGQELGETCVTPAQLEDPCEPIHLWSVHEAAPGEGGMGGRGPLVDGDGGTELCPSADDLYFGDAGERCGCFDDPACNAPTIERNGTCCYPTVRSCRLC